MPPGPVRSAVIGESPTLIWFGLAVGLLGAPVAVAVGTFVDALHLTVPVALFLHASLVAIVTTIILFAGGGLLVTWAALFPMVLVLALRDGGSSIAASVVGSLAFALLIGTIGFALGGGARRLAARVRTEDGLSAPDRSASASPGGPTPPVETTSSSSVVPRRAILAGAGAAVVLVGGAGHVYGLWCRTSPADVTVRNDSNRSPVPLDISVERRGIEVFRATPELGVVSRARADRSPVGPRDVQYDDAIPIGCSLPEDVIASVTTDDGRSVTKTVTFPAPAPPSSGRVNGAYLRIVVLADDIQIDPEISYGVV